VVDRNTEECEIWRKYFGEVTHEALNHGRAHSAIPTYKKATTTVIDLSIVCLDPRALNLLTSLY
jgi:hypothetical protein